jgi:two-component system sensor histidine kinase PhoQ
VKPPLSIHIRLAWGAFPVLLVFLAGAGWAVQQAYTNSVLAQRYARLQATVYVLMAGAELDPTGVLLMPVALAEPRLSLPASGLYASVVNLSTGDAWQSGSTLGLTVPFQRQQAIGQWLFDTVAAAAPVSSAPQASLTYLAASVAVTWSVNDRATPLVFSVLEDKAEFDQEFQSFQRTLWRWLGSAGLLLLLTQALLLRWGLRPLSQMAHEIQRIEAGEQTQVTGRFPQELAGLTHNLNLLMDQERARQTRFKEALDDLAHSLKTPLAALQASLDEPVGLPAVVAQQVARMNAIVVHQLGRAGNRGAARFAPPLALAPVLSRIRNTLAKVYADKHLHFSLDCPAAMVWPIDEGDAFELLGNVLDNAAKWAQHQVTARLWVDQNALHIRISDDGPGIADPAAVLTRQLRLDEQVPGHGIGLAVVRDLLASHHAELVISGSDLGGAQIDMVLPAARVSV